MVSSAGAITGHARLVPVGGLGVGAGAGLALGPLVALLALAVGAEMLARQQQEKKLDRIYRSVLRLEGVEDERTDAQLRSAIEALEQGQAALVDRITVPSSIGLGTARSNLRDIRNRATGWLDDWERGAKEHLPDQSRTHVDLDDMDRILAGRTGSVSAFPKRVATLYQALCLDSRAQLLTSIESALDNPDVQMNHLQAELRKSLTQNAETQERLRNLLWLLAERPVGTSFLSSPGSEREADVLSRTLSKLAEDAARTPDAPGLLTESGRQILELRRCPDGALQILRPAAQPIGAETPPGPRRHRL